MSLESDIFDTLKALVSNRCYPDVRDPAVPTIPYIVWQQVGGSAFSFLESAVVGKRNARIQVACWASTRVAASNLARSAEDALIVSALKATPLGAFVADCELGAGPNGAPLYGARQDFSLFY